MHIERLRVAGTALLSRATEADLAEARRYERCRRYICAADLLARRAVMMSSSGRDVARQAARHRATSARKNADYLRLRRE